MLRRLLALSTALIAVPALASPITPAAPGPIPITALGAVAGDSASNEAANDAAFALIAADTTGRTYFIPPAIFRLGCNQHFAFASAVSLIGAGNGVSILKQHPTCATTADDLFLWDGLAPTLRDFAIDLNTPVAPAALHAPINIRAYAGNVLSPVVSHVRVINGTSPVFLLNLGAANAHTMTNPTVEFNTFTLASPATSQNQCVGMTTVNAVGVITGAHILHNRCVNSAMQIDGDHGVIEGNDASGFKYGTGFFFAFNTGGAGPSDHDNVVANNVAHDTVAGVDINNTAFGGFENTCIHCLFTGNLARNLGGGGFKNFGNYTTYVGNIAYDNGKNGSGGAGGILDQAGFAITTAGATQGTSTGVIMGAGNVAYDDGPGTQLYGLALGAGVTNPVRVGAGGSYKGTGAGHDVFESVDGTIQADAVYVNEIFSSLGLTAFTFPFDNTAYRQAQIFCTGMNPSSSQIPTVQISEAGTYKTTANYQEEGSGVEAGVAVITNAGSLSGIPTTKSAVDNSNAQPFVLRLDFGDLAGAGLKTITFRTDYKMGTGGGSFSGNGEWAADNNAIDGIRIQSGTTPTGTLVGRCRMTAWP